MKRITSSILTFFAVLGIFWVGGVEFGRGQDQAWVLGLAIYAGCMIGLVPDWSEK